MRRRLVPTAVGAALALAATGLSAPASADAAPRPATCRTQTVAVTAGTTATLRLTCRVRTDGRLRWLVRTTTTGARRTIATRPQRGTVRGPNRRSGNVRYRAPANYAGTQRLRFSVRLRSGRTARGMIRIVVRRPKAAPDHGHHDHGNHVPTAPAPSSPPPAPDDAPATSAPTPDPPDAGDGLPPLVPAAPASVAYGTRAWSPAAGDSCPRDVHDRFAVIGPDGSKYPTWHPPTVVDPATGRSCTFGHEHGRDPSGSKIHGWVVERLAHPDRTGYAGIPFGLATEALETWSRSAGVPPEHQHQRSEDHVGYKVEYENDVPLVGRDGAALGTSCSMLVEVHQGSHSPDALSNNVHEVLFGARCDDGTEVLVSTVGRFGNAGEYTPACRPGERVASTDGGYPSGTGFRLIPDRGCVEANVLVPPGRSTSIWALYEKWGISSALERPGGATLASFDAAFGVFNPSRYARGTALARTIDLCWEQEPGTGDRARGGDCGAATADASWPTPLPFDDVRSPFDGTYRDLYLGDVRADNAGGATTWWTDPYGGNAATAPFPGALRQHVSATRSDRAAAAEQVFGRNRRAPAEGVHAPN